jgi:hypothetical protein
MTKDQKEGLFLFLQKFCSDNAGNRLNEWLIESFLNRAYIRLEDIYRENNSASQEGEKCQR